MIINFNGVDFDISKFSNFETIRHSKQLTCECGHATYEFRNTYDIIGYADTLQGYMVVFECPVCFEKYRHHISATTRFDLERFKADLGLKLYLKFKNKTSNGL